MSTMLFPSRQAARRNQKTSLWPACPVPSERGLARPPSILQTGTRIRLFHPRLDDWNEHFSWDGPRLTGLTAIGRATIEALKLNRELVIAIRREELLQGRFPSD